MATILSPHATLTGRALVVLATYNERDNVRPLVDRIWRAADVDLLIIDDSSPDGTGELLDGIAVTDARLTVIHREAKGGVASAHVAAFRYAMKHRYDLLIEMDADFSHPPEDLPRLIAACADADVALGSRCVAGARIVGRSRWRNVLTALGGAYARLVLQLTVHDCTGGYRCSRVSALRMLDLSKVRSRGYGFQLELNWAWKQARVRVVEIPITFVDRTVGSSKMSFPILLESLAAVLELRVGRLPVALKPAIRTQSATTAVRHRETRDAA
jgi:dolichol-phosphate mannosyltransferase